MPIRGVDHELDVTNDNENTPLTKDFRTTTWEENESHSGTKERWCVIYGCSIDDVDYDDSPGAVGWACVECCTFILGCSPKKNRSC